MNTETPLYPLTFTPIFKSMLWGGDRLRPMLREPNNEEATGEAWLLSDHGDSLSVVRAGPLAGTPLRELVQAIPNRLLGRAGRPAGRFPLLLKLLEARKPLSVQVHPDDERAAQLTGDESSRGKTEAWVILEAEAGSRLYAGLRPEVDQPTLRHALSHGIIEQTLHSYQPAAGDCVFLPAGTVHALGAGVILFEIQQTSDITYRLYDWNRLDVKTGQPRALHIEESLLCTDFGRGPCDPLVPQVVTDGAVRRERLIDCEHFSLSRTEASEPFTVGAPGKCRILLVIGGTALIEHRGVASELKFGDVVLLPAEVGECRCQPETEVCLLECGLPERAAAGVNSARRAG